MFRRRPQRHVSGGKNIAVAAAEHQVDIGCPLADPAKSQEFLFGDIRRAPMQTGKVQPTFDNRLGNACKRYLFRPRQADSDMVAGAQRKIIFRRQRCAGFLQPRKDRPCRLSGNQLAGDDICQSGKTAGHQAQRNSAAFGGDGRHCRVLCKKPDQRGFEIVAMADTLHRAYLTDENTTNEAFHRMSLSGNRPVFRFAPSTNGHLHLGHALSALENQRRSQALGGRLLLRIEDIDRTRCTDALEADAIDDLTWLGIAFDGPVFRQSDHFPDYQAALDKLRARHLAYPAFLTRGDVKRLVARYEADGRIWPRDPDGAPLYPDDDRNRSDEEQQVLLASGRRHAWRLDMTAALAHCRQPLFWREQLDDGSITDVAARPQDWGDVVLSRSDAPSSYHLSVVVDDAAQGITHIVRGMDLYHATSVHRLLQELLGLAAPVYHHHRLIPGPDGRKLSKSNHDTSLRELRANGATPERIRSLCGF